MGRWGVSVLVVAGLTLCGCDGSSRSASPAPTPTTNPVGTTTTPRSTTTTPTPEYSFDDSVPPPKLINTGTNYVAILESLEAYGNWLAAHRPDPALATRTVATGTPVLRNYVHDITVLRDNHKREVEKRSRPTEYTILSATANAFSARVVEHITAHKIIDASGRISSERRFSGPTTYIDVVVLDRGRWYLADVDVQS